MNLLQFSAGAKEYRLISMIWPI